MITGSGNVSEVPEDGSVSHSTQLALVGKGNSSACCNDYVALPVPPSPSLGRHNDLPGLQGGDQQNRYHLDLNTYGALIAATEASPENRYATLNDLNGNVPYAPPSAQNRFITLLDIPQNVEETDPTVPEYIKLISEADIALWSTVTSKENTGVAQTLVNALKGGNTIDTIASLKVLIGALQAEDVVQQNRYNALMTLLNSDNAALDTIQEIVDYIEANKDLLDQVLVNKVDKVLGKSLIDNTEITKLATITEERMAQWDQEQEAYSFNLLVPNDEYVDIQDMGVKKIIATTDLVFNGLNTQPGMTGRVLVVNDDEGAHIYYLDAGNEGGLIVVNSLARAETELTWFRTDTTVYWQSRVLKEGIEQTVLPVFAIDDYYKTLDIFAAYPQSEVEYSTDGGPWVPFTGKFNIADIDRPAGFWRARIIEAEGRLLSKIEYSLPTKAGKRGYPYTLPLTLS